MRADALVAPIADILSDPRYFPAEIDLERNRLTLGETSRERLAASPFLDGRTPIASGIALQVPLSDALAAKWARPAGPDRFIFHVAFCGSTLLATLLDIPGRSFAEREPQVLVELAGAAGSKPPALVGSTLELVRALLARSWQAGERNLCKPSNWANNLIPLLTAEPARVRPLFVVTGGREYLLALLRGGRERMAYVLRATQHLLTHRDDGAQLWHQALGGAQDSLEIAARAALVSLHVQVQLFEDALRRGGWGEDHLLTLADIEDDPLEACVQAGRALDLDLPKGELETAVWQRAGRYAKDPSHAYAPERRRAENLQIEAAHGALIERVLDWAALGGLRDDRGIGIPRNSDVAESWRRALCA
jgi:hypothetical protein